MSRTARFVALLLILFVSRNAAALVMTFNEGKWPATWPKELDPLRKRATTTDVATGTQEHVYTIPLENRDEFEKLWPVLLKVRTPGSPLTLSKVGGAGPDARKNTKPCLRIKGPTGSYAGGTVKANNQLDLKELEAGTMIQAAAPWPKELLGPNGELPEYVMAIRLPDGKITWKSLADIEEKRGFHNRARVDIELVIDGDVIDLNRIALPQDARFIDRRFPEPTEE